MAHQPPLQPPLFAEFGDDNSDEQPPASVVRPLAPSTAPVRPQPPDPAWAALAQALPRHLRLGTSSWTYPGWAGLLWDGDYADTLLSKHGLAAYAQHPLLRTVSVDRNFYRALSASQYAAYAAQVPDDFRFVVKAPSLVTDALVRADNGRGQQTNVAFLNAELAVQDFVLPALEGLGHKIGALVFQLSPLPPALLARMPDVLARLGRMLAALPALKPTAPDGVVAVEVRDSAFLTPDFVSVLRSTGATYCLGLHPKLPPISEQLGMLRALWPGPLVCRWNLNRLHGAYGYEDARDLYAPFNAIVDPDPDTRLTLAKAVAGTIGRGQNAFVTISNKAEGSAPLTVWALAQDVLAAMSLRMGTDRSP
ncbi:DUF72 domain-containing protein [Rhodoferax sp.]|uniref:DUF72 domain-containing protein n=1 Tax=Rhodoferax sp. TaxID=50421 RepID=UPI00374D4750